MEYFVRHRTTYRYLQDVSHSWHLAHLRLRATPLQTVHDSSDHLSAWTPPAGRRARIISAIPANGSPSTSRTPMLEVLAESRVTVEPRARARLRATA